MYTKSVAFNQYENLLSEYFGTHVGGALLV